MIGNGWDLRLADCVSAMSLPTMGEKSVDVTITDPPYSEHTQTKSRRGSSEDVSEERSFGFDHLSPELMRESARQMARVTRRWVLVFCDERSDHLWRVALAESGLEYIRTCWWHKVNGAPQFTGDRPAVPGESIVCAHQPGRKRWNGGGKHGFYSFPSARDRVHTAQKPVELIEALVRDFTDHNDLVLDPFSGSGTTGVAALKLGRRFIGYEKDPEFYALAVKRLQAAREQLQIFGAA